MKRSTLFAATALSVAMAAGAMAGTIGVNITINRDGGGPNDSDIASGDVSGLVPQDMWNNAYAEFAGDGNIHAFTGGSDALVGTGGETATITNNSATGNWRTQNLNGSGSDATHYLFDGYLEASIEQGTLASLTIDGLDEAAFANGYDVVVYFGIESGTRNGFVGLNGSSESVVVTAEFDNFDTDPLDGDGVNTYVFSGVTGDSFTVTAQGDTTGDRLGIAGLQIVPVQIPEPASVVLLALVGGMVVLADGRRFPLRRG
ncbi:hypothetical protein [Aeoliella sp.]|uniref:hypothetical protein n=1 Tax=Aeoliella sp. TaxID=2795800 RepID=UPI003CCB786A